ncbi:putative dehydrogenase [Paenibacillus taihuensis]|uniref:Putative dehydrogenase n=1 Tax=Paenibacillus taihuensis TaxID=1156355 RepID=A0A3D9QW10_9BACL|nr:Gfo/Idh/MocA family oxidoreductase [Paenibacillus taihuensis]REE69587.1 putative dehydrogenase [Paenibacillus taihuensis]
MSFVKYNFEYERRLKACFIGAGGHSFRNIYPTFQYAPVDLAAICDVDGDRASAYARQFGASRYYTDHLEMLREEKPDVVFIVTAYHPDGRVQATDLAADALKAGAHVWMEKPTAASVEEIDALTGLSREHDRFVMTGLKKIFFPAIAKAKQIIESPEFGRPASIYVRYPQDLPEFGERGDLNRMKWMLDHIFHPASIINYLMGPIRHSSYEREPFNGGSVTSIKFMSGAVGTLHLTAGISGSGPLERLEVIGEGANVVVDNGVKVSYYRRAERPAYGRSASFLVKDEEAPLVWEPEFSLGQLYNKNIFYLGYVPEVLYFCECVLAGTAPEKGSLDNAKEILKLFECYRSTPEGQIGLING